VSGETIQLASPERAECARLGAEHGPRHGRGRHTCQWPDGRSDGVFARRRPDDQS
jgi:hypothetical protein